MRKKRITIIGSTGSIGKQTLEVVNEHKEIFEVIGLGGGENIDLLIEQVKHFRPKIVFTKNKSGIERIKSELCVENIDLVCGIDGLKYLSSYNEVDLCVIAISGSVGIIPAINAIQSGVDIALANKEAIVMGGNLLISKAKKQNINILPIDSEHSAIFQCLEGNNKEYIKNIILTASGGPFVNYNKEELKKVTPEKALKHPNWNMGAKISIDSSTLMNKGLEVIEAKWLFDLDYDNIDVIIHKESIIHSLVEYQDGSVLAQLGEKDMRLPIQYALTYPERRLNSFEKLSLTKIGKLTFKEPDTNTFPCLKLAYEAGKIGGTMPAVLNVANEAAVNLFLDGRISFIEIPKFIETIMEKHKPNYNPNIIEILDVVDWVNEVQKELNF